MMLNIPLGKRIALIASMFLITSTFGFLQPFVPLYLQASGLTLGQIGLLLGISTGMALLLQPVLGRLSDRFDSRRPMMCGAAIAAGCAYLTYRSAHSFLAFTLISAIGINGTIYLNAAGGVLIGRMAAGSGRGGAAYAGYRVWGSVGYILVSLLTGWLLQHNLKPGVALDRTLIDPVFTYGPLLFFAIAGVVLFVPDFKAVRADSTSSSLDKTRTEIANTRALTPFLLALFFYNFSLYGASAYLSPYMKSFGASPLLITGMFAGGVVCEVLVMTWVGRLTDTWGRRPALAVTFLLLPVRLLLYALAVNPLQVALIQMLHGINFGIMGTISVVFINDTAAEHERGAAQARLAAVQGLATAFGPGTCGLIAQVGGIRAMFFTMTGFAILAASLFLLRVRESHPSSRSLVREGYTPLRPLWRLLEGRE